MSGKLIGVGVGPGDPELLTMKAIRLIRTAPVLAYTVDARGKSFARNTAADHIRVEQAELPLLFSMAPERDIRQKARCEAARKVLEFLQNGSDVVFITEGDPLLYSTFQHLLSAMPSEIQVEVCPGISAMFAAAASTCFSLAIEGQAVMVAPAETAIGSIRAWLQQGHSLVLFKAARRLKEIAAEVNGAGMLCETVSVERASSAEEAVFRETTSWMERQSPYFSIVLIHPFAPEEGLE